jgi:PAS domain S-box-containing protein
MAIKLLIIEDHPVTISGIENLLRNEVEVIGSSVNLEGSLQYDQNDFDLILLDLLLNEKNPVENVNILKDVYPDVPIVIFTCEDSNAWKKKMFDAGVASYIVKTSSKEEIKQALENVIKVKNKKDFRKNYKNYFESLLDNMIEGVGIHQMVYNDKNEPVDYLILDVNKSYEDILGLKKEKVINKLASEVYGDIPALEMYAKVVSKKISEKFKFYYPKMDKHFEVSVSPWNDIGFLSIFTDITEKINFDEKIKKVKEDFQGYFKMGTVGFCVTSPNYDWLEVNDCLCEMVGYTKEELYEMKWIDITHPDDLESDLFMFNQVLENKIDKYELEKRFIHKNGGIIDVVLNVTCQRNPDGTVHHILASLVNITKKKNLENRLKEAQRITKIGNWEADFSTGEIYWSDIIYDIFDLDKNVKPNIDLFYKYVHPDDIQKVLDSENLSEKTGLHDVIHRIILPKGNIKYVHELAIRNGNKLTGTVQDITEIKNSERLQILSNEILKILNSNIDLKEMINNVLTTIKNGTDFSAVGIRLKIKEDFPYFTQKGFSNDFIYAENSLIVKDENEKTCKDENGKPLLECTCGLILSSKKNHPIFTKTGSIWTNNSYSFLEMTKEMDPRLHPRNTCIHHGYGSIALIPIVVNEKNIGILQLNHKKTGMLNESLITFFEGICLNIGVTLMRKYTQDELEKAKEKAEESDKMKLEYLSNMSHDLRTPMNAIIGFSDLLKNNNLSKVEKNDYINTIINNGKFLMALIDDIIDISKIDTGSLKIENKDFELNKLMEELRLTYSKQIKDKNIEIIIDIDVNKNIILETDKYRLRQILMNLIGNAIKFTKSGYVKFGYKIINEKLMIYVEDTGIGIDKSNHKVIFERFKQLNENGSKFKGAGIGLSITKSLIQLLGFKDIKLESELEKGSKFYFYVPFKIKYFNYINDIKNLKTKNKKIDFSGKKILIVEDDIDSITIMKSYLNGTKCQTIEHTNGNFVLDSIRDEKPDIVLLDIGLPGKNGYILIKEIREFNSRIPIIVESALAMPDQKNKAYDLGCDDYISKPYSKEEFLNKINNLI